MKLFDIRSERSRVKCTVRLSNSIKTDFKFIEIAKIEKCNRANHCDLKMDCLTDKMCSIDAKVLFIYFFNNLDCDVNLNVRQMNESIAMRKKKLFSKSPNAICLTSLLLHVIEYNLISY